MQVYIITSAKFEECYIEEWVKYHLNMGFDKIIINDNNPKDYPYNPKDILKKYIDNGQVIVERYYDTHQLQHNIQEPDLENVYTWLYNKYKNEFDWAAKLDIDEFIEISETNNDIKKFLLQNKFSNVLSILIPWKEYKVKDEYSYQYTRLKNNRDRFEINNDQKYGYWSFKPIIRNNDNVIKIGNHFAYFNNVNNIATQLYVYPNGDNANITNYINDNSIWSLSPDENYCKIISNNCYINHYSNRSIEENINHCIKFEADKDSEFWLHYFYKEYYKQYQDMFDNPRDLYKIYFLENENNI